MAVASKRRLPLENVPSYRSSRVTMKIAIPDSSIHGPFGHRAEPLPLCKGRLGRSGAADRGEVRLGWSAGRSAYGSLRFTMAARQRLLATG